MTNIVSFSSVSKTYPKHIGDKSSVTALDNVSLTIEGGVVTSIIGANGAGKSTIIKHIMNMLKPTSGKLSFYNETSDMIDFYDVGYLSEVVSFNNELSVYENLKFNCKLYNMKKETLSKEIDVWLKKMNIEDVKFRSIKKISKGQRQRVAFICAVIHNPSFIILDEPMSGLDPIGRSIIIDVIYELKKCGVTMLICSHLLDDIEKFSDEIILVHMGKVLNQLPLSNILSMDNITTLEDFYIKSIGLKS